MGRSKIEFRLERILYPKNGILELGAYSIVACHLVKLLEGEEIKVNKEYNNFSLISYTPVLFNEFDAYTVEVESEETKYGISYKLLNIEKDAEEVSHGDKLAFLEAVFTPNQLSNLLAKYPDPYDLIANKNTEALVEVKGIGLKSVTNIYKRFDSNLRYQKIISALSEYRLTKSIMDNLLSRYGDADVVIKKVKENVYVLSSEVNGIGFKKCDALALSTGMEPNDQRRIKAFMEFCLYQEAENGNSWVLPQPFLKGLSSNLGVKLSNEEIRNALHALYDDNIIWWDNEKTKIGLRYYYELEQDIYKHINRIKNAQNNPYQRDRDYEEKCIKEVEKELGFELTDEQKEAVNGILEHNVSVLTAFAGCGKTLLTKVIGTIYSHKEMFPCFCTLSGKAAARIYEATGFEGSTIHRTLGYNPQFGQFTFDEDNKLSHFLIIVDEASFLGGELFLSLLKAIPDGSRLVLVGDDKQLPAIGACNIFFDMINSNKIKVNRLTKIHRQAQKSGIILSSKAVREGTQLSKNGWRGVETRGELQDFTIDVYEDRIISRPKLMDYYKHFVKTLKDTENTQIILATKSKGDCNTFDINNEIQEYLNPKSTHKTEILMQRNGKQFILREGDRVINRKNDYRADIYKNNKDINLDEKDETTEIFNGFCGTIKKIDGNKVVVKFDMVEPLIIFSYDKLKNLELSYALTVHLYQGSQVDRIIYLIDNTSYIMNTRELVYTAITRASKQCIVLAQEQALRHAIQTSQTINKHTYLKNLLIENA